MKKTIIFGILLFITFSAANAQFSPVTWTFTAVKVADKTYEIHMKAAMQNNWHLYSQTQPDDVDIIPTTFTINPNPLVTTEGKIKEIGKLEKYKDKILDVTLYQYSNTVTFVQKIVLKAKVKTSFSGSVEYQTCDNEKCLPPKTVRFTVPVN